MTTSTAAPALAARMTGVVGSPVRDLLALISRPEVISFAGGLPDPLLFDVDGLRAAFDRALSGPGARTHLQYSPTEGNPELRERIAERLSGRGLPTTAAELLVTTGSQQALTLVAAALLDPGAVVLVEEPTYLAALQCFQLAGARVVAVPGDEDGIDPEALEAAVVRERPTLLYLVPTFANPTGRSLTAPRRRRVAELAQRHGFRVVEDDPYGELRYGGDPPAPLAAELPDHAIHLGSFSKVGAPGLRLGWLRAPTALMRSLTIVKQAADLHTSTIDQAAAATYLAEADLDAHIARLCDAYRDRRDAMRDALATAVPAGSTWSRPDGGMFVWVRLPGEVDTAALLPLALAQDVAFVPGAAFYPARPDRATLRLSFTTYGPERIAEGMARLGRALGHHACWGAPVERGRPSTGSW
jgi:DNA-binding transcriptional MocR family regulator